MILSKTPLRISFVGGGTDYFTDFETHGRVIVTTINKYLYVLLNKKYDQNIRVSYSETENVKNISSIKHVLIKETLKNFKINNGVEVVTSADIPSSGSGLGSSSALTVGLTNAINKFKNLKLNKKNLAKISCKIEVEKCLKPIGMQDQYSTAFGGFNKIEFKKKDIIVKKIILPKKRLNLFKKNLLLFYTGINRKADKILLKIKKNNKQFKHFYKLVDLVDNFEHELIHGNLMNIGEILHENWMLKKDLSSKVSTININEIYKNAINAGAKGGKLLGAGGGGYLLFFANQNKHSKIIKSLTKLNLIDFDFENNGSQAFSL